MTTEDVIAHELGTAKACKVHSIKIAAPPVQHRFASKAAFINYTSGDKSSILSLDGTTPAWNNDTGITVREQVSMPPDRARAPEQERRARARTRS